MIQIQRRLVFSMNANMCPCEECLKFPICKYKRAVICKDLFVHMHTFSRPGYTNVHLDAGKQNMKSIKRVEYLFEKLITSLNRFNHCIVFLK